MIRIISLPLSKALYEKGLKIETEKWWCRHFDSGVYADYVWSVFSVSEKDNVNEWIPAPSTDELLAVMPDSIWDGKVSIRKYIQITKHIEKGYFVDYSALDFDWTSDTAKIDKVLSEVLGKMCLWLLDNGYHLNGKKLGR